MKERRYQLQRLVCYDWITVSTHNSLNYANRALDKYSFTHGLDAVRIVEIREIKRVEILKVKLNCE